MCPYVSRYTGERHLSIHSPAFFQDKVCGDWGERNIEPAGAGEREKASVFDPLPIDLCSFSRDIMMSYSRGPPGATHSSRKYIGISTSGRSWDNVKCPLDRMTFPSPLEESERLHCKIIFQVLFFFCRCKENGNGSRHKGVHASQEVQ